MEEYVEHTLVSRHHKSPLTVSKEESRNSGTGRLGDVSVKMSSADKTNAGGHEDNHKTHQDAPKLWILSMKTQLPRAMFKMLIQALPTLGN